MGRLLCGLEATRHNLRLRPSVVHATRDALLVHLVDLNVAIREVLPGGVELGSIWQTKHYDVSVIRLEHVAVGGSNIGVHHALDGAHKLRAIAGCAVRWRIAGWRAHFQVI